MSHAQPHLRVQQEGRQCYQVRVPIGHRDNAIQIFDAEFMRAETVTEDMLSDLNAEYTVASKRTSTATTIVYLTILIIGCALILWYSQ